MGIFCSRDGGIPEPTSSVLQARIKLANSTTAALRIKQLLDNIGNIGIPKRGGCLLDGQGKNYHKDERIILPGNGSGPKIPTGEGENDLEELVEKVKLWLNTMYNEGKYLEIENFYHGYHHLREKYLGP